MSSLIDCPQLTHDPLNAPIGFLGVTMVSCIILLLVWKVLRAFCEAMDCVIGERRVFDLLRVSMEAILACLDLPYVCLVMLRSEEDILAAIVKRNLGVVSQMDVRSGSFECFGVGDDGMRMMLGRSCRAVVADEEAWAASRGETTSGCEVFGHLTSHATTSQTPNQDVLSCSKPVTTWTIVRW